MPTALELTAEFSKKNDELSAFLKEVNWDAPAPEQREKFHALNNALNDLGSKRELASQVEAARVRVDETRVELAKPVGRPFSGQGEAKGDPRGFGDIVCSALFNKEGRYKGKTDVEVPDYGYAEFKTTMTTSGAFPPEARRSGRLDLSLQAPIVMTDLLPTIPVTMGTYTYMRETTFTNNAAGIAEAATYPESALAYTPVTATVTKIGTFIPVTEEQLSDVDGMRALIDNRLQLMVKLEVEDEILNSTGASNELNGFYNQVTQTYALAGDDLVFDAILKGMNKVRTIGMANPDMVVLHPNDFIDIRLARTGDGIYIMGNPDQVGLDRLFGVRTVQSLKAVENTALVGDFGTHSAILTRWGLEVMSTNSDGTDFVKDIIKVKARVRLGLAVFRLTAFCEVTGI